MLHEKTMNFQDEMSSVCELKFTKNSFVSFGRMLIFQVDPFEIIVKHEKKSTRRLYYRQWGECKISMNYNESIVEGR